ncbi:PAS domain S-box protein [Thermodesulfobacteriota bacterium]
MGSKLTHQELIEKVRRLEKENSQLKTTIEVFNQAGDEKDTLESQLRTMIDSCPAWMACLDTDGNYLIANNYYTETFHIPLSQVEGHNFKEFFPPDLYERHQQLIAQSYAIGKSLQWEDQHQFEKNRTTYLYGIYTPLYDKAGSPWGVSAFVQDVTKLKQAEKDLKESEEKYRTLFEHNEFLTYITDSKGNILLANLKGAEFMGRSQEKIIGKSFFEMRPDRAEMYQSVIDTVLSTGETFQFETLYPTPKEDKWLAVTASPLTIGKETGLQIVSQDITVRKQAEEALKESEEKYRKIFNNEIDAISIFDIESRKFLDVNDAFLDLYGYNRDEILQLTIDAVSGEPEKSKKAVQNATQEGDTLIPIRHHKKKDGTPIIVQLSAGPFTWKGQKVMFAVVRDITEHIQAKEALSRSEEKFRNILDNLMDVYFETTPDGTILYSSPSGAVLSGYSVDELIGNNVDMLYYNPQDREGLFNELKTKGKVRDFELIFQKKNGETYDVSINADLSFNKESKPFRLTGTIRDITQYKKLKEQLNRSKKMESLGLMAGGIAHDLNNILSGLVGYPELLMMDLPEDSPMISSIEAIKDSGQRAAAIVEDLLTIAKGVAIGKEVLNLNKIISESIDSNEYRTLKHIHPDVFFEIKLDSELLNISCSSPHMQKILLNLVMNAVEAIEYRGMVTIKTENKYLDEPLTGYDTVQIGEYILLTVSDTGSGISEEHIKNIFEPFFTKKVMGRSGTGLGLTVVWNTVQDHNGYINVNSSKTGTTFEMYFPVSRGDLSSEQPPVSVEDYLGHGECILVVDDEKDQRNIGCGFLNKLGYSAKFAASGEEAIHYLKKHKVDLIVLDMIMPGMNGRETYQEAIKVHPEIKAIITSGFAETTEVEAAQRLGAGKYIKKPYTLEKIGLAVRDELKNISKLS